MCTLADAVFELKDSFDIKIREEAAMKRTWILNEQMSNLTSYN